MRGLSGILCACSSLILLSLFSLLLTEILRQSGSDPSLATLDAVPRHVFENTQKTLEELQVRFGWC